MTSLYEKEKDAFGDTHDVHWNVFPVSRLYRVQRKIHKAKPYYLDAYNGRKTGSGERHHKTCTAQHNLAILYYLMDQYTESEELFLDLHSHYLSQMVLHIPKHYLLTNVCTFVQRQQTIRTDGSLS